MRAIVTGQVGVEKKKYLQGVVDFAGERGEEITLYNVGDMMYAEAPDVNPGQILNLPLARLRSLRRAAMKDVIRAASTRVDEMGVEEFIFSTPAQVALLASPLGSFTTGANLVIDGGLTKRIQF